MAVLNQSEGGGADPAARRERLVELYHEASECTRCPLAKTRTKVVFGAGDADADLMFVGEAPGAEEDRQGLPFVGRAGTLLTELLEGIGLSREQVFIANVLKCLRYDARVQLADGSWERIGRLVRSRYAGKVMSVDSDGQLVARRVTDWHATPLAGRRVHRLRYRSGENAGAGRVGVQLTGDHPVLTERGYVAVEQLKPDDRVATGQGLSKMARDVVCGTLLGDRTLSAQSACLAFGHSEDQAEYAHFKRGLLAELSPRVEQLVAAVAGGPRAHSVIQVRTLAHRALGTLRADFYRPTKLVPPWLAEELNERMLAIWFMDDGYMRIRTDGRQPRAEIATVGFSDADRQVLLDALSRLGLPAKASRKRLYFDLPTTRRLSEMIAPYVPPSMRYKLHPEIESRVAFDPSRFQSGPPEVMFDEVEVEDVTDFPRHGTTFFCIDVEETHNFVTAGGVVHNCRPPGNRDPQPLEVESCSPYLERQVQLIEPRVIGTLGNFATRLLTGARTPISRVRGTPQVHSLGGRAVFLMPLFHPAAALRTPSLVESLREDFAMLPELLRERPPDAAARESATAAAVAGAAPPRAESDQLDLFG